MNNFSKFLYPGEGLRLVINSRGKWGNVIGAAFWLILDFFIMFPSIKIGTKGLFLWLVLTICLFIFLLKTILQKETIYLLTSNRLVTVPKGSILLDQIEQIKKSGRHDICLIAKGHKYFLFNIKDRDLVYQKMQNLV